MRKKDSGSQKNSSKNSSTNDEQHYIDEILGIDRIIDNVIFMKDGTVSSIIEVLPLNFYQMSVHDRNNLIEEFESFFRIAPARLHFKVRTEDSNIQKTLDNIIKANKDETNPQVLACIDDYIEHIKHIQGEETLCQKFYIMYEYEGDINGKKSNDINEIYRAMQETRYALTSKLISMGNLVVTSDNEVTHVCDILYKFFNPNSAITESFDERFIRLKTDMDIYNTYLKDDRQRTYTECEFVGPRGLDLTHTSYMVMDGQYHTYLSFKDNGYPSVVVGAWLNIISSQKGVDVDVHIDKVNRDRALSILSQYNRITSARANLARNDDKYRQLASSVQNVSHITERMKNMDEDLYEVMVIITIRNNSYQEMMMIRNSIIKALQGYSIYTNDCFSTVRQYFDLTMPLIKFDRNFVTSVFARDKHNFLTSSLASLYMFTAFELYDETGYVLGRNSDNGTLVAFNNFNTMRYSNANMLFIGTSGAGKTFTMEMLARRMRMTDVRVIVIAPVKGRKDFYSGCVDMGGSFITLGPATKNTINIMAIMPAAHISDEEMEGFEQDVANSTKTSLLSKKITSVITFVQLLMDKEEMTISEETTLSVALTKLYADFGITNDDASIWKDRKNRILKDMPIIEDLYSRLEFDMSMTRITTVLLRCIEGDCQSLNGPTNVDLSNKYIVFDVDKDAIPERLLPPYMYVAYDCSMQMAKESEVNFDAVFLDEVWLMMMNEAIAKQVKAMVKLLRAYAACVVLATQDIEDFLNCAGGFGASVLNNTDIKFFLKLTEKEIDMVQEYMHFTGKEYKILKKLNHQALICSNGEKIKCDLLASEHEINALSTDPNVVKKRKLAAMNKSE